MRVDIAQNILKIAVLSDIHCHRYEIGDKQESFLMVGMPGIPRERHPIESLEDLIRKEALKANLIVVPGDITNRIDPEGLSSTWDQLIKLKKQLSSSHMIATLGNHDVDSHHIHSLDSFQIPRSLSDSFPLESRRLGEKYWADGYVLIKKKDLYMVLIVNSVIDHNSIDAAKRGTINDYRLARLKKDLERERHIDDFPFKIAVIHHHPILHSIEDMTPSDVLPNGDQLLDTLSSAKFSLVIHGHKHMPRIYRYSSRGNNLIILASGSFSAFLKKLGSRTRNLFHLVSLVIENDNKMYCNLENWEFNYGRGWNPTTKSGSGFLDRMYISLDFKYERPTDILSYLRTKKIEKEDIRILYREFPQLKYYLPDEIDGLQSELKKGGFKFGFSDNGAVVEIGKIGRLIK